MEKILLTVVVPVYNENESLTQLYNEIVTVAAENGYHFEVVFVDDGSTDSSRQVIETLAQQDERVKPVSFRRNFGKAAALQAGINKAAGEFIITMDADLQDNPREIPDFVNKMNAYDVISGWKKERHDPWHKVFPSHCFNAMVSFLTGVKLHDHNCGMKCYRREVFENLPIYGEMHRFIPVLAAAQGFKVGEKVVEHRPRQFGRSKYGFSRFIKGFLDLGTVWFLTRYGERPQHFFGTIAVVFLLILIVLVASMAGLTLVMSLPHIDCAAPVVLAICGIVWITQIVFLCAMCCLLLFFGLLAELTVYKDKKNRE